MMSKWSEKDMDKLFQMGSEKYDFEYDPEAWKDMEQLLDERKRRRGFWWWFAGLGLVGILALAFIFYPAGNEKGNEKHFSEINPKTTESARIERDNPPPAMEAETDSDELEKQGDSLPGHTNPQGEKSAEKVTSDSPQNQVKQLSIENKNFGDAPPAAAKRGGSKEWMPERPIPKPKETETPREDDESALRDAPMDGSWAALSPDEITSLPVLPIPPFSQKGEELDWPEPPIFEKNKKGKIKAIKKSHAFSLGGSFGSEWNSVGFGDFSQRNWKYGLHAEYHFQKKFALGLGATWMRMHYDAGEGEYVPEPGFWTDGIAPQSTYGVCDMLELPLTFTYHPKGFSRDGLFFSAGISSYWIMEEHYWYHYDNPRPDLVFYWGAEDDVKTWFNLALFSFGYQKFISPRTSLSFEPYAQFPLNGVGHGAVKIYSLGLRAKVDFWLEK